MNCDVGYVPDSTGVCIQCSVANCDQCFINGGCEKCLEGYYLSGDGNGCLITCPNGFYKNN